MNVALSHSSRSYSLHPAARRRRPESPTYTGKTATTTYMPPRSNPVRKKGNQGVHCYTPPATDTGETSQASCRPTSTRSAKVRKRRRNWWKCQDGAKQRMKSTNGGPTTLHLRPRTHKGDRILCRTELGLHLRAQSAARAHWAAAGLSFSCSAVFPFRGHASKLFARPFVALI